MEHTIWNVWTFNQWRTVISNIYETHGVVIIHCQILTLYHSLGTVWHLSRTLSWVYEMEFTFSFLKVQKFAGCIFLLNTSCCETFNSLSYRKYILSKWLPLFHWPEYADLWSQHYLQMFMKITKHCMYTCMDSMHYSAHYISITCNIAYILSNEEAKQNLSDCLSILDWQLKKNSVNLDSASSLVPTHPVCVIDREKKERNEVNINIGSEMLLTLGL